MGFLVHLLFGAILVAFSVIENATDGWGGRFHFFHFPYLNDGSVLEQLTVYIILFINLFFFGFVTASIARRFGARGLIITAVAFLLITSVIALLLSYYGVWMNIFQWFAHHTAVEIAYWLILPGLLLIGLPYILLRRATV
ncbi:hypothetical protein [Pseudoneobacillus sp. C159]